MQDIESLISKVIDCAINVRKELAKGYLESVYRNALIVELRLNGIEGIKTEYPIRTLYKGNVVGEFRADLIIDDQLIVELKAVEELNPIHEAQLVNYLTSTNIDDGLLINFGGDVIQIRRKYRQYTPQKVNKRNAHK